MRFFKLLLSRSVTNFVSPHGLFSITFPKGWRKIYSFISKPSPQSFFSTNYTGLLQVSALYNDNSDYLFDINFELDSQKKEYKTSTILEVNSMKIVNWNTTTENSDSTTFHFIIGRGKVRILITYILFKSIDDDFIDNEFNSICQLVSNIKINA